MEDALIEVPVMRRFAGIDWIGERIPDETTILAFRHLLEKHELGQRIFDTVKAHLKAKGMAMKQGTIIDATLITAPSSTKNKQGERDPEMHQTKKGNQWYYGMKVHIGVDAESGLIHSVETTAANVHDLTPAAELLHGEETVVYADAGYQGIAKRPEMKGKAIDFRVAMRPGQRRVLPESPEGRLRDLMETAKAHFRAKGEHPFRVIKQQFGFQKTRLRGLTKTAARCMRWRRSRICFWLAVIYRRARLHRNGVSIGPDQGQKSLEIRGNLSEMTRQNQKRLRRMI
jgi:IS5 family transposase